MEIKKISLKFKTKQWKNSFIPVEKISINSMMDASLNYFKLPAYNVSFAGGTSNPSFNNGIYSDVWTDIKSEVVVTLVDEVVASADEHPMQPATSDDLELLIALAKDSKNTLHLSGITFDGSQGDPDLDIPFEVRDVNFVITYLTDEGKEKTMCFNASGVTTDF